MKLHLTLTFLFALVGLFVTSLSPVQAQATETKVKKIPFHGKLSSFDRGADTITIVGKTTTRVFHVTSTTKVIDGSGNPSSLSAAVVGEDVGGSYAKDESGNMMLFSLRLGAKSGSEEKESSSAPAPMAAAAPAPAPEAAPAAMATTAKPKKQSFSGKVVSVSGDTLVVHGKTDLTFTVTSSTKITSGGSAASLSSATAGTKVSGSYEKSADGSTLTLMTLKIAK
jgi:hypothetical protein